ncbi:MAG: FAD-binding oxidoreductase [Chloroflexota bacterium]
MDRADVVIIGGGISGTAAAYELAGTGVSVTLLEKGALASMASGWTLAGVRQSGRDPTELPLAMAAIRRWEHLSDELGADVEYRQDGNLRLARTPEEVPLIQSIVEEQRAVGLELDYLPDNARVREVAPALAETIAGASFCPTDGHANPIATVNAFAAAARQRGAAIRQHQRVLSIETSGGRVTGVKMEDGDVATDVVVVAAGVYSDRLLRPLGLDLPLDASLTAVVQTVAAPPMLQQVLGVAKADFAGRQEVNGRFRFTGGRLPWEWPTGELHTESVMPSVYAIQDVLTKAMGIVPQLGDVPIARVWAGLLDNTPDALPVLERAAEVQGVVIAAGFSGHGFCLGPITGQIVCELVTRGESTLPIEPFRRARFAGRAMRQSRGAGLHG